MKTLILALSAVLFATPTFAQPSDEELATWRDEIRTWAPVCEGAAAKAGCDDGDSTLWNGLLCFSGEAWACDAVKNMQSEDGRVWRSPRRKGTDQQNSFSRDMAFGALLYIVATGDSDFGQKWSSYIQEIGALCPDANDGRCNVSLKIRETFNTVANAFDFDTLPLSIILSPQGPVGDFGVWLSAQTEPTGYTLHLVAMHILIRSQFANSYWLNAAMDTLVSRQPNNPFFRWMKEGDSAAVRNLIADQIQTEPAGRMHQWSFERDTEEEAWLNSMGWEFVFLINVL